MSESIFHACYHPPKSLLLLLLAAIRSLVWANSPWSTSFAAMLNEPFGVSFGDAGAWALSLRRGGLGRCSGTPRTGTRDR